MVKTRTIVVSFAGGLILGLACAALGGVEPTPFHQLINELDSVENVLDATNDKIKAVLGIPPDDIKPNALANKLYSMADKLWSQNSRVADVIDTYPAVPPDPCNEVVFIAALEKVGSKASSIAELAVPPEPCIPEVEEAIIAVEEAALAIVNTVNGW